MGVGVWTPREIIDAVEYLEREGCDPYGSYIGAGGLSGMGGGDVVVLMFAAIGAGWERPERHGHVCRECGGGWLCSQIDGAADCPSLDEACVACRVGGAS